MKKLLLAVFIFGCFMYGDNVYAQEGGGVSISPLTFELTANPGDVIINKIRIYNPTDEIVSIKMEAEDFKPVGEEGRVITTSEIDEDTTYSLRKWIDLLPREFILEPNKTRIVDFVIEVPQNAEPGGKYGSILAGAGASSTGKTGAAIQSKVGSLILLSVSGDIKEELVVETFSTSSFQEYGPVPFEIRFENKGTVHVKPRGFITITDLFGKKVIDVELSSKNVIPGATRKIDSTWDTKWLFGKYSATIIGVYGESNQSITSNVIYFWVLPWKLMLGVSVILLIMLLLFFRTKKRWKLALKILFKGEHHAHS